eukprot:3623268-Pleurochrysis_carterae.AAC.3
MWLRRTSGRRAFLSISQSLGAPMTEACRSQINQQNGEMWLKEHPEASAKLLESLRLVVVEYLSQQVPPNRVEYRLVSASSGYIRLVPAATTTFP